MVKCPRCEQMVDETIRTTCPLCFTPIAPDSNVAMTPPPTLNEPQPVSPTPTGVAPVQLGTQMPPPELRPGSQTAGGRVSLMGEIIPDDGSNPQNFTGSNVQAMKDPRAALDEQNFEEAEATVRRKNLISYILFFVVVFGGGGYYYWFNHRTNPKDQIKKYFEAAKKLDYQTGYQLTALSDDDKKNNFDEAAFETQMKTTMSAFGNDTQAKKFLSNLSITSISEPKVDDKGATKVKVMLTLSVGSQSIPAEREIEVKNEGGYWKIAQKPSELLKFGN